MAAREALQGFRPQSQPMQREILVQGSVFLIHPGVGKSLFWFPAYSQPDPTDPSKPLFGVCHSLALDACRVITNHAANNRGDFLAKDSGGEDRVSVDDVKLLPPGDYYYFLGTGNAANHNYPIVNRFSAFRFPSQIPDNWYNTRSSFRAVDRGINVVSSANMSDRVSARDKYCILTGWINFNKCAHLVPEAEWAWFEANEMTVYSMENTKAAVNAHTNGVLLRDDVHRCLGSDMFVFYPAGDGDSFMAYFVNAGGYPDYTEQFHRRLVSINDSVAVEFIYARFAYAVIKLLRSISFFDYVPDNDDVKLVAERDLLEKGGDTATSEASEDSRISGGDEESDKECSSGSNQSTHSGPQESYAEGDERWKERLFRRIPEMATLEEVEHPPDTVACHSETPHMMRLTSKYMKENPQVWQTSTTPEGATRDDEEGWYAAWMTRPL
ncbi:hypothetical protein LXA43DRAFT_1041611 [Ganoderma leucocontextum]|nr:hypothetical protein LXA43DRAFT_1041611 [Ganoderma leucocontextum]